MPRPMPVGNLGRRLTSELSDASRLRRDLFIEGLLKGLSKRESALYAGCPEASAAGSAYSMFHEHYVQERLRELREAMAEEQLITRKELILNVKTVAFDEGTCDASRVSGSALLAKILGFEAAEKKEIAVQHSGVMEIPVMSLDDWERDAKASQQQLHEDVRK